VFGRVGLNPSIYWNLLGLFRMTFRVTFFPSSSVLFPFWRLLAQKCLGTTNTATNAFVLK